MKKIKINITSTPIVILFLLAATLGSSCSKDQFDLESEAPLSDLEATIVANKEASKSSFKILPLKSGEPSILIEGPAGDNDDGGFDIAVQDSTGNEIEDTKVTFSQSETTTLVVDFEIVTPLEGTGNLHNGVHIVSITVNKTTTTITNMENINGVLHITVE